jgi:hypothetical protein
MKKKEIMSHFIKKKIPLITERDEVGSSPFFLSITIVLKTYDVSIEEVKLFHPN